MTKSAPSRTGSPSVLARWKRIRGKGHDLWLRAICGNSPCPGSLGILEYVDGSPDPLSADGMDNRRKSLKELDDALLDMLQRDHVPGVDQSETEGRRTRLLEMRGLIAESLGHLDRFDSSQSQRSDAWNESRSAGFTIPGTWAMTPDFPHPELGTPQAHWPRPIYYGYADTGFRISYHGKRSKQGYRVGRRPFPVEKELETLGISSRWEAPGQFVAPPCRIFCPVCGTLNDVGLPAGFKRAPASP